MTPAAYVLNRTVLKRLNQTENEDKMRSCSQSSVYTYQKWDIPAGYKTAVNWHEIQHVTSILGLPKR